MRAAKCGVENRMAEERAALAKGIRHPEHARREQLLENEGGLPQSSGGEPAEM